MDKRISKIIDGLYQSGFPTEYPEPIQAVLCLNPPDELAYARRNGWADPFISGLSGFAWLPVKDDTFHSPGLDWLDQATRIIENWRKLGWAVLTHCAAGISRSSLVNCAFLMRCYGMDPNQALATVKAGRPQANPNMGFLNLLNSYHILLRDIQRMAA